MAVVTSAWFLGSVVLPQSTFAVNGVDVVVAAGTYYLFDASAGRSLLAQVAAAMLPQAAGAAAVLTPSGYVRLSATGALVIAWGTATVLRDLLGFNGNLALATSFVAPNKSTLYWSPGKPAMFMLSPLGVAGQKRHIVNQSTAAYSGRAESTSFGFRTYQRFAFEKIDFERMMTADALGGEFDSWFTQVAVRSARFKVYHNAEENSAGTTTAFTYETVLGPYLLPLAKSADWDYKRSSGHTWTDYTVDHLIEANGCPEIS